MSEDQIQRLRKRWDRLDQREKAHEAEGRWLEDERWAIAKVLQEAKDAGTPQAQLAAETGRSVSTIERWTSCYRKFGHMGADRPTWTDAAASAYIGGKAARRESNKYAGARNILRDRPERVVPQIAKALERPEVAKLVLAAMSPQALVAMTPDPVDPPITLDEVEPEAPEPAEPEEPAHIDDKADSGQHPEPTDDEAEDPAHNAKPAPSGQHSPQPPATDQVRFQQTLRSLDFALRAVQNAYLPYHLEEEVRKDVAGRVQMIRKECEELERRLTGNWSWLRRKGRAA